MENTPRVSRKKVDRQSFEENEIELVTPKKVKTRESYQKKWAVSRKRNSMMILTAAMWLKISMRQFEAWGKVPYANVEEDQNDLLGSSTIKAELGHKIAKHLEKYHKQYTSNGPPVLGDNPTVETLNTWKAYLKIIIDKTPGYDQGMILKRLDTIISVRVIKNYY